MCLSVNYAEEQKFIKKYKKQPKTRIKVYKEVNLEDNKLMTPSQYVELNKGWFKADATFREALLIKYEKYTTSVYEGIHAYVKNPSGNDILECEMVAEDVIGIGCGEIVAKKLWVPSKEYNRLANRLTFHKLKDGQKFKFLNETEVMMKIDDGNHYVNLTDFSLVAVYDGTSPVVKVR